MARGRPLKANRKRSSNGRSRGEPDGIHPETLAVRNRQLESLGIPLMETKTEGHRTVQQPTASNRLTGFTLGLLRLRGRADALNPGGLSQAQYDAGEAWAGVVSRHAAIMGYKLNLQAPLSRLVPSGPGDENQRVRMRGGGEPSEHDIQHARKKFRECYDALAAAARVEGARVFWVTYAVCVDNIPVQHLTQDDYGYLRIGLNAIARRV